MAMLITVTGELLCINVIKLSGILVTFSCQKCCLGGRNTPVSSAYAISAVTNLEKKLKWLLCCTPKMYFFITDHIRLFCTYSRRRFKFSP